MFPQIFKILNVPALQSKVGAAPARIYDFGVAPADVQKPYIVLQQVANDRLDNVSDAPCGDIDTIQLDIYADTREEVRELARAVRGLLDASGLSNRLILQLQEPDTLLYRVGMEVAFIDV